MLSRLPTIAKSELPVGNMIYSLQIDTLPVTSTEIHTETLKGKTLVNVLSHVQSGKWPDKINDSIKTHYNKQNELTIKDWVILWGLRVIVAEQLRNKVLKELHQNHPGISWRKSLSRIYIWFPNTDNEIENIVNTCQCCKKVSNEPNKSQPHPWDWPTHPMDPVHIDYFNYNKNYFLIMLDSYSK